MADEQWYYVQAGQRLGPVPAQVLQGMLASATLSPNDLVWREGMGDWQPAGSVQGLMPPPAPYPGAPFQAAPLGYASPGMMNYYTPPTQYVVYAGFWLRFVAFFIDGLVMIIPNMAVSAIVELTIPRPAVVPIAPGAAPAVILQRAIVKCSG